MAKKISPWSLMEKFWMPMVSDLEGQIFKKLKKTGQKTIIQIETLSIPKFFHESENAINEHFSRRLDLMYNGFEKLLNTSGITQRKIVSNLRQEIKSSRYFYGMVFFVEKNGESLFYLKDKSYFVQLDLSMVKNYTLFPGQIIMARGINPTGFLIIAEKIYCFPIIDTRDSDQKEELEFLILKGPFEIEKLRKIEEQEITLIILGPFVYTENIKPSVNFSNIDNSQIKITSESSEYEIFVERLKNIVRNKSNLKIYMVPSSEDPYFEEAYPQIYNTHLAERLCIISNPAVIDINRNRIYIINTNILEALSKQEIIKKIEESNDMVCSLDTSLRQAYHIVFQKSLFPLDRSSSINGVHGEWENMRQCPDIIITSSSYPYFNNKVGPTQFMNIKNNIVYRAASSENGFDLSSA